MTDLAQLNRRLAAELGLPTYNQPSELSAAQLARLTNAVHAYIVAHPAEFSETQVMLAQNARARGGIPEGEIEYTVGQAAKDFAGAVFDQAVSINDAVNPFSERNRGSLLARITVIAGVVAVLYFAGPALIGAVRKAIPKK